MIHIIVHFKSQFFIHRTLKSAQFGDVMIQELESQGLRLHKEKQNYVGV